jgi:hypothetical protein
MSKVLDAVAEVIDNQLRELKPVVDDYEALRHIREAIPSNGNGHAHVNGNGATARKTRTRHAIPMSQRLDALVHEAPDGISVKEAARRLKTSPTYVYAVVKKTPHVVADDGSLMYIK